MSIKGEIENKISVGRFLDGRAAARQFYLRKQRGVSVSISITDRPC